MNEDIKTPKFEDSTKPAIDYSTCCAYVLFY